MLMRTIIVAMASLAGVAAVPAQLNTVITNGSKPFAEGVLKGYVIQADGTASCADPYVIGRYISCNDQVSAAGIIWRVPSRQRVWAETNGTLGGMIVVGKDGSEICHDPEVWNQFRGPLSYIVCGS